MEGDRILAVLKSGGSWKSLYSGAERYLQPVIQISSGHDDLSHLCKYELFCLKLLKQCVGQLSGPLDSKKQRTLLDLSDLCCSALRICDGVSGKMPPFTFAKILLHLAKACLSIGAVSHCVSSCQILHASLTSSPSDASNGGSALLKHVFELLWRAAVHLDKQDDSSDKESLEVRRKALESLLVSGSNDVVSTLEYVMKADHQFCHSTSLPTHLHHVQHLYTFHATLLPSPSLLPPQSPCHMCVPVLQYWLHRVVLATRAEVEGEGEELLEQALTFLEQHSISCANSHSPLSVQALTVRLWCSITTSHSDSVWVSQLGDVGNALQSCLTHHIPHSPVLTPLMDAVELVISALTSLKKNTPISTFYFPLEAFPSLKALVLGCVAYMDLSVKTSSSAIQGQIHTRQLRHLFFLTSTLNDLLTSSECDSSHPHSMQSYMSEGTLRRTLVDSCLPILQKCCDIISQGGDLLPLAEHRWLGNDAYRLARSLAQEGLHQQACQVLELSCQELVIWCQGEFERSLEVKLLQRYLTMVELYGKVCDYAAVMATLCKSWESLPSQQLQMPVTIQLLTEQWVWLKRCDMDMLGKSLLTLLDEAGVAQEMQVLYLEQELSLYQGLSQPSHTAIVTVLQDLITLHTHQDTLLVAAHYSIQLACVCRHCTLLCQHTQTLPPTALLAEALAILSDHTPSSLVHQGLATAHLWRAIVTAEQNMSLCQELAPGGKRSDSPVPSGNLVMERVTAICLSAEEAPVMMSHDIMHALSEAVEAWQEVWFSVKSEAQPLDLEQPFHRPMEMLQHLMLTAMICTAHSQVELAVRVLSVLLHICRVASQHLLSVQAQALALFTQVLSMAGCVAHITPTLKACVSEQGEKQEVIASLHCSLAVAHSHLSQGELTACRSTLLNVLDQPFMSNKSCSNALLLAAKTKLLTAQYLLHRNFSLQPSSSLLDQQCVACEQSTWFHLSPVELARDAVKILWKLSDHKSVRHSDAHGVPCLPWHILLTLLEGLHVTAQLHALHCVMGEAYHYAREGAMLAKSLHLQGWYCEFLLLLYDIFVKRAQMGPSALLSAQLAQLLKCSHLMDQLAPPVAPPTDHTPSSPEDNTTEDEGSDDSHSQSLISLMSSISLSEAPIEEHHPSPSSSPSLLAHQPYAGTSWLCQTLCLISIASHSSLAAAERLQPDHLTCHVTRVASALSEAEDLLGKHKKSSVIDFAPVGTPFTPAVSASKGRGRGHRGRTTSSARRGGDGVVVKSVRLEGVRGELACGRARCLLLLQQPQPAQKILSNALAEIGSECKGHELSLVRSRLHYYMGVALAQKLEVEREGVWLKETGKGHEDCVKEFLTSYQLCFPATPTILLRDTCLWLALLLGNPDHAHHFLSLSQHISLTHQTALSLGKKLRRQKKAMVQSAGNSSFSEHVQEVRQVLQNAPPAVSSDSALLIARQLLLTTSPLAPCHTSTRASLFPPHWSLLTIALSPKPHPSSRPYLLVSKVGASGKQIVKAKTRGRPSRRKCEVGVAVHVEKTCGAELAHVVEEFHKVLEEAGRCVTFQCRKKWWAARHRLNEGLQQCLLKLQSTAFPTTDLLSFSGPVLLILGRHLHQLPWECLPVLHGTILTRTPSLTFATAHKAMVGYQDEGFLDVQSAYFVVNPQGDLKKTERLFGEWFSREEGWEGVVGVAPPIDQLSTALQEKDMYIYCGHSVGHFLGNAILHSLHLRAAALLIGCSSAELAVDGQCDPCGPALSHLLAGCPTLVGCLWSVTDGDIDRFCQSLVKSLLSLNNSKPTSVPEHVHAARLACKLSHLVGSAPVVYGLPLIPKSL